MLYRPCVLNIFLDINALLLVTMIITSDYSIFKISKSNMNSPDQQNEEANESISSGMTTPTDLSFIPQKTYEVISFCIFEKALQIS
jgi:hypothetical protein